MRDYAFPAIITPYWSAVFALHHLGFDLFCDSYRRGELATADDGGRAFSLCWRAASGISADAWA
ncbi:hypothetical protein D3C76_1623410 [compost metagenome]